MPSAESLRELLQAVLRADLVDAHGEPCEIRLLPPLAAEEIDAFAARLPCPLPAEVRRLLGTCRGVEGLAADPLDFTGALPFAMEEVFPHGLPIAGDGFGNFWVVDLLPESTAFGPVYFACHDPPVILYQAADLHGFLVELVRASTPPFASLIDDVHDDRLFRVWRDDPGVVDSASGVDNADEVIAGFADELGAGWRIVDMRGAAPGFGFAWGRSGSQAQVRRCGSLPIFAYQAPPRESRRPGQTSRRPGFWARWFGR